jgi:hypothetical protein
MKAKLQIFIALLYLGLFSAFLSCGGDDPAVVLSGEKAILSFSAPGQIGTATINSSNLTVAAEVECGTDLTILEPTFDLSQGATSAPPSGTAEDYSNQVTITVTAEDGTTARWRVTISEACANATDILTFSLPEETGSADIDSDAHTIDIEVENATDLTMLTPTFTLSSGATSAPASGMEGDYSNPVTITVTAEDGITTQDWTVTVTEAASELSSETDILSFSFPEEITTVIDYVNHYVVSEVENGTDLTGLTPTFTLSEGATSQPVSGTEGDYTGAVTIEVTAEDGNTTQEWTVLVIYTDPEPSTATDILVFGIPEQTALATIDPVAHTVAIEVVNGTDLTGLTPVFVVSRGATSDPESGIEGDYSSPATIRVTAEDGTTFQDWTVTVTEASSGTSSETDILSFFYPEQANDPVIDGVNHIIWVEIPIAAWTSQATWTLSPGATSVPVSGTMQDYLYPVTIEVTAEDGVTKQDWTVNVVLLNELDFSVFCSYGVCENRPDLREECQNFLIFCLYVGGPADRDECLAAALLGCGIEE